ncbi:hypothetical protein EDI_322180 [Entamoeba dispar SAW760]|uniref:Uncharacterized protein n=1 Tax=Entamoeba dispar (strain ATCC PRA-260 / SAW760) TaxID=370354 RepID=B0E779_ENTDS|nr:uncharacterized protein EDI_322180 [Entamoeba dispar SAW760]EDR29618.1 hypothetical protein EDI_322180 [Entamoeba dispar SAW760]|eukprot:EDR29618.1 hypothetical protein EDI_322180 [Entamoeba dispar SAW760]
MITLQYNYERTKRRAEMAYLKEHYPQNIFQFHKIENELSEHWFIIPDILKSNSKQIAEKGEPHGFLRNLATNLIPIYGQYQGYRCWCNILARKLSSKSSEDEKRIFHLAFHVYKTKELIEKYGNEIKTGKICGICIEKNFNGNSDYIIDYDDGFYQDIELKFMN